MKIILMIFGCLIGLSGIAAEFFFKTHGIPSSGRFGGGCVIISFLIVLLLISSEKIK